MTYAEEVTFSDNSWSVVADTKGRSEEAQRSILRGTLAYQTLKIIEEDPGELVYTYQKTSSDEQHSHNHSSSLHTILSPLLMLPSCPLGFQIGILTIWRL